MIVTRNGVQIEAKEGEWQIGDTTRAMYLGLRGSDRRVWGKCENCGKGRWTKRRYGKITKLCPACASIMNSPLVSRIPPVGSPEANELIEIFKVAHTEQLVSLAEQFGYTSIFTLRNAMWGKYGVKGLDRRHSSPKVIERKPTIELPPVKLLTPRFPKTKGDEEIAILHCGDGHGGKITSSFNKEVYRSRMETMFQSVMTIVNLHRNMYPIRKLWIINTGDNVQGENPYQGSKIGEVEMGARDQVKKIVAPMWNNLLGSFAQEFEEVEFEGIPGNHGHDALSPETSSYDLLLYDVLEAGIGQQKNIKINTHEEWSTLISILGFRCFCFHGDGIPCQQGVPFFALDRKLKSWYMQYGGFSYAFGGHFHKRHNDEISSKLEYFMVGSLVSDDDWALKKLGISSNPSQNIFGIHPAMGITWRYGLVIDREFLMEKLPDTYGGKQ